MSIKFAILGLLHKRELHGYRIKQLIERDFGYMWTVNYGQIYPILKKMQHEGLVTMKEIPQPTSPPRKLYSITQSGKDEFMRWLASSPERGVILRDQFLLRFPFLGFGRAERAMEMLSEQIAIYQRQLEFRKEALPERSRANTYARLVAELGIEFNETMLQWLRRASKELDNNGKRNVGANRKGRSVAKGNPQEKRKAK